MDEASVQPQPDAKNDTAAPTNEPPQSTEASLLSIQQAVTTVSKPTKKSQVPAVTPGELLFSTKATKSPTASQPLGDSVTQAAASLHCTHLPREREEMSMEDKSVVALPLSQPNDLSFASPASDRSPSNHNPDGAVENFTDHFFNAVGNDIPDMSLPQSPSSNPDPSPSSEGASAQDNFSAEIHLTPGHSGVSQASSTDHLLNESIEIDLQAGQPNSPLFFPEEALTANKTATTCRQDAIRPQDAQPYADEDIQLSLEFPFSTTKASTSPGMVEQLLEEMMDTEEPKEEGPAKQVFEPALKKAQVSFGQSPKQQATVEPSRKSKKRKSKDKKLKDKKKKRSEKKPGNVGEPEPVATQQDTTQTRPSLDASTKASQDLKDRIAGKKNESILDQLTSVWESHRDELQKARTTSSQAPVQKSESTNTSGLVPGRIVEASKAKAFPTSTGLAQNSRSALQAVSTTRPTESHLERNLSRDGPGGVFQTNPPPKSRDLYANNIPLPTTTRQHEQNQITETLERQASFDHNTPPSIPNRIAFGFPRYSNHDVAPDSSTLTCQYSYPRNENRYDANPGAPQGPMRHDSYPERASALPPDSRVFAPQVEPQLAFDRQLGQRGSQSDANRETFITRGQESVPEPFRQLHLYPMQEAHDRFRQDDGMYHSHPVDRMEGDQGRQNDSYFEMQQFAHNQVDPVGEEPPFGVYCSESFIESWQFVPGALLSGNWSQPQDRPPSRQRRIDLIDTPFLDQRKVDIELSCQSAILVYDFACVANARKCKEVTMNLAKIAAIGCYRDLIVILVHDNVADTEEVRLAEIQLYTSTIQLNSIPPTSIHIKAALPSQLPETIADIILASELASSSELSLIPKHVDDLTGQRAQFLLDAVPTFTVRGALQSLEVGDELVGQADCGFSTLMKSARLRQNASLRATATPSKARDVTASSLIQLSEVSRVDTRKLS